MNIVSRLRRANAEEVYDGVSIFLLTTFQKDEELEKAFLHYAFALGLNQLVKALDIKADPDYKPETDIEKFLAVLSNLPENITKEN